MTEQQMQTTRRLFMAMSGAAALGAGFGSVVDAQAKMSDVDKRNVDAVMGMSAAWKSGDVMKIAAFMHDKVAFRGSAENMDTPPTVGKPAFIDSIKKFLSATKIDMRVLDAFALNPVVMTCHHQLFENKERGLHEDLYIGCFYMQDGKIREWNDYGIIPYATPRQKDTASKGKFIHLGGEQVKGHG